MEFRNIMKAVGNQQSVGIIYQAYNILTKKSYVGQTVKDLATRRSRHYSAAKTKKYKFAQALKKYAEKCWICKVLSPQLCKISRMASKSAKSVFDFLRLTRSWLKILAASGVNFAETVATGAEFCFSEREFRLNFLP